MEKSTRILLAAGIGMAVGGVLGLLFAPDKGLDTRKKIIDASNQLTDNIKNSIKRGKEGLESLKTEIKERLESITENSEDYV